MKKSLLCYLVKILIITCANLQVLFSNSSLHPVVYDGRLVYIDTTGKIILDDDYETKFELGKIGIDGLTKSFPIYIFPEYAFFSENKATVRRTYGFWFIRLGEEFEVINNKGKTVITTSDRFVGKFSNNLAVIKIPLKSFDYIYDEKYTFVDTSGKFVFVAECDTNNKDLYYNQQTNNCIKTFKYAGDYSEGRAIVLTENHFNFIDLKGNYISNIGFEDAKQFTNGLAPIRINSKWGAINSKGDITIEPKYTELWNFNEGFARFNDGKFLGFIDISGNIIFKDKYLYLGDFSDGYAVVKLSETEYNYLDRSGNLVSLQKLLLTNSDKETYTPQSFMLAANFSEVVARVLVNGKWGFINTAFEFFIEPVYDFASDFRSGFAYIWKDDKLMIINRNKEIIWTYQFETK